MISCLSVSYKHASLPSLESIALKDEATFAHTLFSEKIAQECVLIQTCHRVEIYCVIPPQDRDDAIRRILKTLAANAGYIIKDMEHHDRCKLRHRRKVGSTVP